MFKEIKLIIGLGNPDKKYENTYHNVGFSFVDWLKNQKLITYYLLLKSEIFMNESGRFVKTVMTKHKIKLDQLLIVHDDSDIKLGQYKLSFGRGSAGHKGVESIIKTLKTKNFWRLRIGIRPIDPINPIGPIRRTKAGAFVLKKITTVHKRIFEAIFLEIKNEVLSPDGKGD